MAVTKQAITLATSGETTSSLYHFLESLLESTDKNPILSQYTVSKMKSSDAYLIETKSKDSLSNIVWDDQVFIFEKHHLRIDKMAYTKENSPKSLAGLSPSHISIYYRSSINNQSLVIHLYYSMSGNLLSISSKIDETKIDLKNVILNKVKNEIFNIYNFLRKLLKEKSTLLSNLISKSDNLQNTLEKLSIYIHKPAERKKYYEKSEEFTDLISKINRLNDSEYDCRDKRIEELVEIWKNKYDKPITLSKKDDQGGEKNETTTTTNITFSTLAENHTKKSGLNTTVAINNSEIETFETRYQKFNDLYSRFPQIQINETIKFLEDVLSTNNGLHKKPPEKSTLYTKESIENVVFINNFLKDLEIFLIEISVTEEKKFAEKIIELKLKIRTLKQFFHGILLTSGATGDLDTFKTLFEISPQKLNMKLCLTILGIAIFTNDEKVRDRILKICDYLFEKSSAFGSAISLLRDFYEVEAKSNPNLVTFLAQAVSLERLNVVKRLLAYDQSICESGVVCNSVFLSSVIVSVFQVRKTSSLDYLIELKNHGALFNNRRTEDLSNAICDLEFLNESKIDKKQISKIEKKNYANISDKNIEQEWSGILKKFSSDLEVAVFYTADNAFQILSEYCDISQLTGAISLFSISRTDHQVNFRITEKPLGFQCSIESPQEPKELTSSALGDSESKGYFSLSLESANPHIQFVANKLVEECSKCQNQKEIQQLITNILDLYKNEGNSPNIVMAFNNNQDDTRHFDLMKVIILLAIQKKPLNTTIGETLMWTLSKMSKNNYNAHAYLTLASQIPDVSSDLSSLKTGRYKALYDHIQKSLKKITPSNNNDYHSKNFMPLREMKLANTDDYVNNNNNDHRNNNNKQQGL